MSLVHVRLRKCSDNAFAVRYSVESSDFGASPDWRSIGELVIDRRESIYRFEPSPLAIEKRMLPPEIYRLSAAERQKVLEEQYEDHGWGAWAMAISHWAGHLIEQASFPDMFP